MRPLTRAGVFSALAQNEPLGLYKDAFRDIAEENLKRDPYKEIEKIFADSPTKVPDLERVIDIIVNDILDSSDFEIPEIRLAIKSDLGELSKYDEGILPRHYVDIISNPLILAFHIRENSQAVQHPENTDSVIKIRLLFSACNGYLNKHHSSDNTSTQRLSEECKKIREILMKYSHLINYRKD